MRLAEFILANLEPILVQWEEFARGTLAGSAMESLALRDHAEHILRAAARDMGTAQTAAQQSAKSVGRGEAGIASDRLDTSSDQHALARVESGFDLMEVVSEYRALRASVIRLWQESTPGPDSRDLEDLTRFNESIDQSLSKAVASYTRRVTQSRDVFLAILSHDLRNPLSAVMLLAKALAGDPQLDAERAQMAASIAGSADVIARMVNDLLEFARTRLGSAMPTSPVRMDLSALCSDVLRELRDAHPARELRVRCDGSNGEVTGVWDPQRLRQVIYNLVANALRHGSTDGPVEVTVGLDDDDGGEVVLTVHNKGEPIPPEELPTLFDPLLRAPRAAAHRPRPEGSIGLGLYIVRQILLAHGGRIDVESTAEAGTTFTVRLPRPPGVSV